MNQLPVNVFDLILVGFIILGILQGRKHGMSGELLNLIKWSGILVACTLCYEPLGRQLAQSSPFSLLTSYMLAYSTIGLVVYGIFALIQYRLGGKILGSDVFGQSEYYLGMFSGLIRFTCILILGLAVLNARYFSQKEVEEMVKYQNEVYGSDFFPGLHSAQTTVFQRSLTGPWIRRNLEFLLIKPTPAEDKRLRQKEYALPG